MRGRQGQILRVAWRRKIQQAKAELATTFQQKGGFPLVKVPSPSRRCPLPASAMAAPSQGACGRKPVRMIRAELFCLSLSVVQSGALLLLGKKKTERPKDPTSDAHNIQKYELASPSEAEGPGGLSGAARSSPCH